MDQPGHGKKKHRSARSQQQHGQQQQPPYPPGQQHSTAHSHRARENVTGTDPPGQVSAAAASQREGSSSMLRFGDNTNGNVRAPPLQANPAPRQPPQQEEGDGQNPLLSSLLDHLVELAHQAGFAEELIEVSKARLLLEATAGQIPLAAQLYWDDVLARTHQQQQQHRAAAAAAAASLGHSPPGASVAAAAAPDVQRSSEHRQQQPPPPVARQRSLRRRLETDYELLQQQRQKQQPAASSNNPSLASSSSAAQPVTRRRSHGNSIGANQPPAWAAPGVPSRGRMPAPPQAAGLVARNMAAHEAAAAAAAIAERNRLNRQHRLRSEEEIRDLEQASRQEAAARDGLENHFQDPGDDHDEPHGDRRGQANENDNPIEKEDEDGPRPRLVADRSLEASVSVSDDEAAAEILRTVNAVKKRMKKKAPRGRKRPSSSVEDVETSASKRMRTVDEERCGDSDDNMEDNGYLSDNDWIWESLSTTARDSIPAVPPMDFLWGVSAPPVISSDDEDGVSEEEDGEGCNQTKSTAHSSGDEDMDVKISDVVVVGVNDATSLRTVSRGKSNDGSEISENEMEKSNGEKGSRRSPAGDDVGRDEAESNPADEDVDGGEDDKGATIPVTWLRSGFSFPNDEKLGLCCNVPNEDDIAYLQWKQQVPLSRPVTQPQNKRKGGKKQRFPPPPYHCASVTLLPAIVTAFMQAGVAVVKETSASSPRVTCQTSLTPYFQLDAKARSREWEPRFVDAVTSLLVIAAQSSKQRKTKALERAKQLEQLQRQQEQYESAPSDSLPAAKASNESGPLSLLDTRNSIGGKKKDPPSRVSHKNTRESTKNTVSKSLNSSTASAASAKWQKLYSKLQLCPICWWEKVDPNTVSANQPHANSHGHILPNPEEPFSIPLSYTHICDLKSYVKSNLDAFLGTGGCALFLETILRIHGKGAVQRMVQLSREEMSANTDRNGKKSKCKKLPPLVQCNCQEKYQKTQQKLRMSTWPGASQKSDDPKDDAMFGNEPCNDCASIELVSLLLTGRVYSSWKGWSTSMTPYANLGVGILTDQPGEVGRGLTRPSKPVWIVKGPSQYSVLWLNERNSAGVLDESKGFVANMTHWNCWYTNPDDDDCDIDGVASAHNPQTNFRFMANKNAKAPVNKGTSTFAVSERLQSVLSNFRASNSDVKPNHKGNSTTLALLEERRKKEKQAVQDRTSAEHVGDDHAFSSRDLERVKVHPDDSLYYDNYHLWRYDIQPRQDGNDEDDEEAKKPRGDHWTPFYRLKDYEKMLVETKFGPRLAVVLRTRWPGARIDRMEPSKPLPYV